MDPKRTAAGVFLTGLVTGGAAIYYATRAPEPPRPAPAAETQALHHAEAARMRHARGATGWWDVDAPKPSIPPPTNRPESASSTPSSAAPAHEERPQESDDERYQRFVAYWTNQTAVARANFIASAALDEAESTRFDVLVAAMNIRLQHALDPVIEKVQTGWRPTPEDRARMMGEIGQIMAGTYDELDRNMPADWRDATASNEVNLVMFVDPKYAPYMRGLRGWSRGR